MVRKAKHCEKEEAAQKALLKKSIQKNNTEGAKIYAGNAIRKKNEGLNYLRLAARFDSVSAQIDTAVSMGMVSKTMSSVVTSLDKALASNNMEQVIYLVDMFILNSILGVSDYGPVRAAMRKLERPDWLHGQRHDEQLCYDHSYRPG